MKKSDISFIENKINMFEKWACEEREEAKRCDSAEAKRDHYEQARLNECAANTLHNLLVDLA